MFITFKMLNFKNIQKLEEENTHLKNSIKALLGEKETIVESYRMNQQQLSVLEEQMTSKTKELNTLLDDFRSILS